MSNKEQKEAVTRRLYVEIDFPGDEVPSSEELAELVEETLTSNEDEVGDVIDVRVTAEPTNNDQELPGAIREALRMIDTYADFIEMQSETLGTGDLVRPGLDLIRHGRTDLTATLRCIEFFKASGEGAAQALASRMSGPQFGIITRDNIHQLPTPLLHAMAHQMAHHLGREDCSFHEDLERDDLIEWIIENTGGEKRTLN